MKLLLLGALLALMIPAPDRTGLAPVAQSCAPAGKMARMNVQGLDRQVAIYLFQEASLQAEEARCQVYTQRYLGVLRRHLELANAVKISEK